MKFVQSGAVFTIEWADGTVTQMSERAWRMTKMAAAESRPTTERNSQVATKSEKIKQLRQMFRDHDHADLIESDNDIRFYDDDGECTYWNADPFVDALHEYGFVWGTPEPETSDDLLERALSALVSKDPADSEAEKALVDVRSRIFRAAVR